MSYKKIDEIRRENLRDVVVKREKINANLIKDLRDNYGYNVIIED